MLYILYPKSSVDDGYTTPRTVRLMFLNQAGWRQQKNKPAREPCFHIVTKTGKFLFRHNLHHICFHHYHQYHHRHQTTQPGFKSLIIKPLKKRKRIQHSYKIHQHDHNCCSWYLPSSRFENPGSSSAAASPTSASAEKTKSAKAATQPWGTFVGVKAQVLY